MSSFRMNKILELFRGMLVFGIVFFVPLFFALVLQTNNVFELNKMVLFRILVLIFFLLMVKNYFSKFLGSYPSPEYSCLPAGTAGSPLSKGRKATYLKQFFSSFACHVMAKPFYVVFLFSLTVSTLFSINHELSFFGFYDRQEGFLSYFYYITFFILLLSFLRKSEKRVSFVLWSLMMSSIVVCAYALLQAFGMDPLGWTETTKMRVTATFGQPNNLGSYLLFVIPVTGYFFFKYKNLFLRSFLVFLLLIQFLVLYYSFSTSAWLGLFCGMVVMSVLMLRKKLFTFKYLGLILGIAFSLFVIIQFSPGVFNSKISNLLDLRTGSTAARMQFWQSAVEEIKKKPFLGYGLDIQQEVLLKNYNSDWAVHSNVNVQPSRVHNLFLDILLTQGFLGFVAHLLLWGMVFYALFKNIKNNHKKHLNLAVLVSLVAYFVYLQFNFPHVTTQIYFWLFFAVALNSFVKNPPSENFCLPAGTAESPFGKGRKLFVLKYLSFVIMFLLLIFSTYKIFNYESKRILADHYYMEMRRANLENRYGLMMEMYKYLKEIDDSNSFYNHAYIQMTMPWVRHFDSEYYNGLVKDDFVQILSKIKTNNFNDLRIKALIYEFLASSDKANSDKAEESYRQMIELSPEMPFVHRIYANFLINQERVDEAQVEYAICLESLPSLDSPGLNSDHRRVVEREMEFCGGDVVE